MLRCPLLAWLGFALAHGTQQPGLPALPAPAGASRSRSRPGPRGATARQRPPGAGGAELGRARPRAFQRVSHARRAAPGAAPRRRPRLPAAVPGARPRRGRCRRLFDGSSAPAVAVNGTRRGPGPTHGGSAPHSSAGRTNFPARPRPAAAEGAGGVARLRARPRRSPGAAVGQPSARYLSRAVAWAVPEPPHHGADRHLLLQQQLQNRRHSRPRSRRARAQPAPGAGPACPPFPRGRCREGIPAGEAGGGRAPSPCQHAGHGAPAPVRARLFLSCAVFPSLAGLGARPSGSGTRGLGCGEGQRRPLALPAAPRLPARRHPRRRMAEDSPKRRKANFNEAETEVLIEQVLKHEQLLFAAGPGRASAGQKRKVWELIRHKVNPVAACPRDVEDLKKRWRDLKRRDRSKLCRLSQGCGPPAPPALGLLMPPEELPPSAAPPARRQRRAYGSLLPAEAVPIVGGIDTLELPGAVVGDIGECGSDLRGTASDPPPGVPHRSRGSPGLRRSGAARPLRARRDPG